MYIYRLCGSGEWTLGEIILCGVAIFTGLVACSGLYHLANYTNIMVLTKNLRLWISWTKVFQPEIRVHRSLVSKAVAEGESQFYEFMMSERPKQLMEEFEKINDIAGRHTIAEEIHEMSKEFTSKSNGIRSKLLSFDPKTIVMEKISQHDNDGNYPVICASNNFDLPLVMFLVQAGQVTPVNFNGERIIIKTSDKIGQFYVKVLEILVLRNFGEFNKEDGSNILQRLVEKYTPEADMSIVKRIIYYCNNGPDGTMARPNRRGETLLHHVKSEDLCRFLIKTGATIDSRDYKLRTPLHSACYR